MSATDLVRKTQFEKQIPYTLLKEIAESVKESEAKLPVFPAVGFMQIDRIQESFSRLGYSVCEEVYGEDREFDAKYARAFALSLLAETIRFIKTLPS